MNAEPAPAGPGRGVLRVERAEPHVAVVTLDRPERMNSFDPELFAAMPDVFDALGTDDAVRAVIVTGAGRAFSAGADLGALDDGGPPPDVAGSTEWMRGVHRGPLALYRLSQPTIAAVNGPAAGGGLGLALACDVRIAARSATFRAPFVKMGLGPDFGCSDLLPRAVGSSLAMEMMLTGRVVDAEEALRSGLVSQISDDALAAAIELARQIAAMPADGPPRVKAAVRAAADADHETVLMELEAASQGAGLAHPEFRARVARWLAGTRT